MATSFQQNAERCLHQTKRQAHKPWISSRTLHILEERDRARTSRNPHLELLHGQVKQSVKMDRSQWLDDLLKTGDWNEIRRLHKGHRTQSGRLKNVDGKIVESDQTTSSQCSGHHAQLKSHYIQHVMIHCWCLILPYPRPK